MSPNEPGSLGWEDQSGGGDNDFEDLLTYVTGIQCAGGGDPCQADGKGVCADGVMQCRDGALARVPTQTPSDETCNGLDDNCDGQTDEGDDLCPKSEICVRGRCEPKCGTGEFRCATDEVCVDSVCLDASCADKKCDAGSVCRDSKCVAPCDGTPVRRRRVRESNLRRGRTLRERQVHRQLQGRDLSRQTNL